MKQENIFIELPETVKLEIKELALLKSFKVANDILDHNSIKDSLQLLRKALESTIKEYEADKWFKNETTAKKINELNEVIQKRYD